MTQDNHGELAREDKVQFILSFMIEETDKSWNQGGFGWKKTRDLRMKDLCKFFIRVLNGKSIEHSSDSG